MLNQQETFKIGEWAPEAGAYACVTCDRTRVESIVELDDAQPLPICPRCKEAGREEQDQLWVRVRDLATWRRQQETRWPEMWK